jgi:DHHA1 domain protein
MISKAFDAIKKYDVIIIHRHSNPDGDAMGSQIGLKRVLQVNFPDKKIYAVGDDARRFSFMDGSEMDVVDDAAYKGALAIVLDTSAKSLISDERYALAETVLRIDHHIFVEDIADIDIDDTSFESCCGLVAYLVREWGLEVDSYAAKALFTGMVTDSGRFYYDSVTPRTFELASFLLSKGFNPGEIYANLYADTYENVKKRAQFVLSIQFTKNNVAYSYSDKTRVEALGMEAQAVSRGYVNTMGDLKGVDAWVNFTECEQGVLCEIRSKNLNINQIAVAHGGGGHLKASGATLKDKQEALQVLDELDDLVENGERI